MSGLSIEAQEFEARKDRVARFEIFVIRCGIEPTATMRALYLVGEAWGRAVNRQVAQMRRAFAFVDEIHRHEPGELERAIARMRSRGPR